MSLLTWWTNWRQRKADAKQKIKDDHCEHLLSFDQMRVSNNYGFFCPICNCASGYPQVGEYSVNNLSLHRSHGKIKYMHTLWGCQKCRGQWIVPVRDEHGIVE